MANMLAILGASGVGKSTVSEHLVKSGSFVHIDFDDNHPFAKNDFPAEWDEDIAKVDFTVIASTVRGKMAQGDYAAAVLSFANIHVFSLQQLKSAAMVGIVPIILWATEDQCIAARSARSKKNRRRFNAQDQDRFRRKNRPLFEQFGRDEYAPYRVPAFRPDGTRWPDDHLPMVCKQRMTA